MDLSSIVDTPDAEFEILHPVSRAPTGNFFRLLGPQHPIRKAGFVSMKLASVSAAAQSDEEIIAERELQFLVDCTTGWRYQNPANKDDAGNFIKWEGGNLVHTPDAVRSIYGNPKYGWLRDQVDTWLGKRDRFISDSSTTSAAGSSGVSASTAP